MMKKVLVTGASRGIGFEIASLFAKHKWQVFAMWHRAPERLCELADCPNVVLLHGDVASSASVAEVVQKTGDIDLLINNAAISSSALLTEISEDEWDEMMNVNLKSVFLLSKAYLPGMIRRQTGRIINISSIFGTVGGSCEVHYSTAKAGVIGFTKALAKEVGPSGIQVNCIAPGVIDTEMNAHLSNEDLEELKEQTPLGRIGTPHDVANVALYLAEDSFITGEVIHVGGGFLR